MADVKISNLPAADTPLAGTEQVPLVQDGVTKKATVSEILSSAGANVTDVTASAPVVSSGGTTPNISMPAASASVSGYLTSTDWNTFNNKGSGTVTSVTGTSPIVSSGGTTPAISMPAANGSTSGYLTSTDWNTFNNKQPAGSYLTNGGALGTPSSGTATNLTGLPLSTGVTGVLPVANGGSGTATPSLVAGTNVTISGTWPNQTINATGGGGGGDVTGPASSTDNAIARFDGTTGKVIQNSSMQVNDAGEVNVGVWKGTEIGISYGGTGAASASQARGNLLPSYTGNSGKVLAVNTGATDVEWISAGGVGTVTSVSGAGTVSGISLSGTVTSSGSLTLGGALDLSSPPAIGGTTPAAITGTTVTATTKFVAPYFDANGSSGGALRTNGGSACLQWGAGGGVNLTLDGAFNMNPANASISIAPTGTGSLTINPATAGTISNMAISGSTNTLTNIGNGSLTNSSVTVNGTAISLGASGTVTVPISTGVTGLGTGVATALAVNVGTAGAPVINGGDLGTPSSGTLTNATGLPISTGVSGLGTGVATFLTTPSSANLLAAVTDETGTGALVFGTAPALTNPTVTNYVETAYSANSSTAITLALTNGTVQIITLTGNATITMPTAVAGKSFLLMLKQDATGSRTVTWSTVVWPGGTAPTITSTASKMDIYSFFSDGTNWYGVTVGQNY